MLALYNISVLASFTGQIIRTAGGFYLAAVLRKGFLLQRQWIFSSMFGWIWASLPLLNFVQLKKTSEQEYIILHLSVTSDSKSINRLPGSSTHGIFQAKVLEWVAIAFSKISIGIHKEVLPFRKTVNKKKSQ